MSTPEAAHSPPAPIPAPLAWVGDGAPRMEVAHIETTRPHLMAYGTQLGASYELRYWLEVESLRLELVGERRVELELGEADFFDLGWSPLFNSVPVLRDGLLGAGPPREYRMCWVNVPSLAVSTSQQRYEPIGDGLVAFEAGDFSAAIEFDDAGFVLNYPGIAVRVPTSGRPLPGRRAASDET